MVRLVSLLGFAAAFALLVASTPTPGPVFTIPIKKRTSGTKISLRDIVERDRSRIAHFSGHTVEKRAFNGVAINQGERYVAEVTFCLQTLTLEVDTGSANLWARANAGLLPPSSCGIASGGTLFIPSGSDNITGTERSGSVSYGGLTVPMQSFGAATHSPELHGADGVIGLGPVGLTFGTVSGLATVPTFMDNLYNAGTISVEVLGIYFAPKPLPDVDAANGELTIGGVDPTKYTGTLTYFPRSAAPHYSSYWSVDIGSVTCGSTSLISSTSAMIDTGTTFILMPPDMFKNFLAVTNGTTTKGDHLTRFSTRPTSIIMINIGSTSYPLTPMQYLIPGSEYGSYGLGYGWYYAWIAESVPDAVGPSFILGQKFLENYYSVYDTTNSRIGFATRA
ncbi:putative aspartyl protease [Clavulina sp. PMI_390]|nr:putative aspartyl protease [Clavulina sp. PMI_390]